MGVLKDSRKICSYIFNNYGRKGLIAQLLISIENELFQF